MGDRYLFIAVDNELAILEQGVKFSMWSAQLPLKLWESLRESLNTRKDIGIGKDGDRVRESGNARSTTMLSLPPITVFFSMHLCGETQSRRDQGCVSGQI